MKRKQWLLLVLAFMLSLQAHAEGQKTKIEEFRDGTFQCSDKEEPKQANNNKSQPAKSDEKSESVASAT